MAEKVIVVDAELHTQLKTVAALLGITMQEAADRALKEWLKEYRLPITVAK